MSTPQISPYEELGGADAVRALVDRFYDLMDSEPKAATIRGLHAKSLKVSREKLYLFLSGWLGGPDLYVQKYGHPRLRQRHLPFSIGATERDQWLACMEQALDEQVTSERLRQHLKQAFWRTANHMRNSEEEATQGQMPVYRLPDG